MENFSSEIHREKINKFVKHKQISISDRDSFAVPTSNIPINNRNIQKLEESYRRNSDPCSKNSPIVDSKFIKCSFSENILNFVLHSPEKASLVNEASYKNMDVLPIEVREVSRPKHSLASIVQTLSQSTKSHTFTSFDSMFVRIGSQCSSQESLVELLTKDDSHKGLDSTSLHSDTSSSSIEGEPKRKVPRINSPGKNLHLV